MITIRLEEGKRKVPPSVRIALDAGLEGDRWRISEDPSRGQQVSLINARVLSLIEENLQRWELAGDNLIVDLDLSPANLPVGQRIRVGNVGNVALKVTDMPHRPCAAFRDRYGRDAVSILNSSPEFTDG